MSIKYKKPNKVGLATQIADSIRSAIIEGRLVVEERLPSETELAERFNVSRPTVREALKLLAAQNLIRTQRGPTGGAFVNRLSWSEAHDSLITTSTLLIGMNDIPFEDVAEARFAMEKACIPFASANRKPEHIEIMRQETEHQRDENLSDEAFCASDVCFHRALVEATENPVLTFQMAGVIEAMQPLMNMITYCMRDRARIADLHSALCDAIEDGNTQLALTALEDLGAYTLEMAAARRLVQNIK